MSNRISTTISESAAAILKLCTGEGNYNKTGFIERAISSHYSRILLDYDEIVRGLHLNEYERVVQKLICDYLFGKKSYFRRVPSYDNAPAVIHLFRSNEGFPEECYKHLESELNTLNSEVIRAIYRLLVEYDNNNPEVHKLCTSTKLTE